VTVVGLSLDASALSPNALGVLGTPVATYLPSGTVVTGSCTDWDSSDTTVATVNATTGVITQVKVGSTTITASYPVSTANDVTELTATCNVTVDWSAFSTVSLTPNTGTLNLWDITTAGEVPWASAPAEASVNPTGVTGFTYQWTKGSVSSITTGGLSSHVTMTADTTLMPAIQISAADGVNWRNGDTITLNLTATHNSIPSTTPTPVTITLVDVTAATTITCADTPNDLLDDFATGANLFALPITFTTASPAGLNQSNVNANQFELLWEVDSIVVADSNAVESDIEIDGNTGGASGAYGTSLNPTLTIDNTSGYWGVGDTITLKLTIRYKGASGIVLSDVKQFTVVLT
jgi:uncharacterized protein YjdB